tara:strand:- start:335 stop:763 length:429 start_codon:yes stop_codon:yes gene_type:complete
LDYIQKEILLPSYSRGFHLITNIIIDEITEIKNYLIGTIHIFIKHTSASLSINENSDKSVRNDLETFLNKLVPEDGNDFTHIMEGADDMPAHIKNSLLGTSIIIPITNGNLNLGTWQGIYLCEHRNNGGPRSLVITISGENN